MHPIPNAYNDEAQSMHFHLQDLTQVSPLFYQMCLQFDEAGYRLGEAAACQGAFRNRNISVVFQVENLVMILTERVSIKQ